MRQSGFVSGTPQAASNIYVGRVGKLRCEWVSEVRRGACQFLDVTRLVKDPVVWSCQSCPRAACRMADGLTCFHSPVTFSYSASRRRLLYLVAVDTWLLLIGEHSLSTCQGVEGQSAAAPRAPERNVACLNNDMAFSAVLLRCCCCGCLCGRCCSWSCSASSSPPSLSLSSLLFLNA